MLCSALSEAICNVLIWEEISSVALVVWPARFFISVATTAKPFPASPVLAASIVAFNASRFVCSAIPLISLMTPPISCAADDSSDMVLRALPTSLDTCFAMALLSV